MRKGEISVCVNHVDMMKKKNFILFFLTKIEQHIYICIVDSNTNKQTT